MWKIGGTHLQEYYLENVFLMSVDLDLKINYWNVVAMTITNKIVLTCQEVWIILVLYDVSYNKAMIDILQFDNWHYRRLQRNIILYKEDLHRKTYSTVKLSQKLTPSDNKLILVSGDQTNYMELRQRHQYEDDIQ